MFSWHKHLLHNNCTSVCCLIVPRNKLNQTGTAMQINAHCHFLCYSCCEQTYLWYNTEIALNLMWYFYLSHRFTCIVMPLFVVPVCCFSILHRPFINKSTVLLTSLMCYDQNKTCRQAVSFGKSGGQRSAEDRVRYKSCSMSICMR